MSQILLDVQNLTVRFKTMEGWFPALKEVSLQVQSQQTTALVGESGSGKSVLSLSIMGLLPPRNSEITHGKIKFHHEDLYSTQADRRNELRGKKIAMIFQEPMTSLNPVMKVGDQIEEVLKIHTSLATSSRKEKVIQLLNDVLLPEPEKRRFFYPHQLSGGQKQRVMIAMALATEPELLIADEPTTALDVSVQKEILDLLQELQGTYNLSTLLITHDLNLVRRYADHVIVMRSGELVEEGSVNEVLKTPKDKYTQALLQCHPRTHENLARLPTIDTLMEKKTPANKSEHPSGSSDSEVLFSLKEVSRSYGPVRALKPVNFEVMRGEVLGVVGESGSGKSTLSRLLLGLEEPSTGEIFYDGKSLNVYWSQHRKEFCKKVQVVFQDPFASLNPRKTVEDTLLEPLRVHCPEINRPSALKKAEDLLSKVGLSSKSLKKYPHEFSGGQRQRVCIARALMLDPEFIVCDESVSALDVSVQAQVLNLLLDLKEDFQLTYFFITHDLSVVRFFCDRMIVLKEGKLVEEGFVKEIVASPSHSYTKNLLDLSLL